jgi:hypothetical protein
VVVDVTDTTVPAVVPNLTATVVVVKLVPVIVTVVLPVVRPFVGESEVTVGAGGRNLNPVAFVTAPPESVTLTVTLALVCDGVFTFMVVVLVTETIVAAVPPKVTASVVAVKFVPVMVTVVPPAVGPEAGATVVTVGAGGTNLNPVAFVPEPPESVTVTLTLAATWAGVFTFMVVVLVTDTTVPAVVPNFTAAVVAVKLVPVIVTVVFPAIGPEAGESDVTVGTGGMYLNPVTFVTVPPESVTLTVTLAPFACDGVFTLMVVVLVTTTLVAAVPPKVTASVVATKLVPVIVTVVPPAVVPEVGASEVTVGAAGTNLNPLARVAVPPASVTVTVTDPAVCAFVVAWSTVGDVTV